MQVRKGSCHGKTCLEASAQSDQDLHCPLIESLDTAECMNEGPDEILLMYGMNLNVGTLR